MFAAVVAAPPVIVAAAWLGALAMTADHGTSPIWNLEPRNLAEAAAFRDAAALVLGAQRGDDLNLPGDVRPGIISSERQRLTPIEAAALARHLRLCRSCSTWVWNLTRGMAARLVYFGRAGRAEAPRRTAAGWGGEACRLPDER